MVTRCKHAEKAVLTNPFFHAFCVCVCVSVCLCVYLCVCEDHGLDQTYFQSYVKMKLLFFMTVGFCSGFVLLFFSDFTKTLNIGFFSQCLNKLFHTLHCYNPSWGLPIRPNFITLTPF